MTTTIDPSIIDLTKVTPDIYMDEQSSMNVTVITVYPSGVLRDITGAKITWIATFNGQQQVKKDTPTMMVMLSPVPTSDVASNANAGQKAVVVDQVAGFGGDPWGRPIPDFAPYDIVNIVDEDGHAETNKIATIDAETDTLTMFNALSGDFTTAHTSSVTRIISSFTFQLLPGDTILPATKVYGTPILWNHLALAVWPSTLSPGNIYQAPTTIVAIRGRMFINPISDMS